ncbi:putative Malate dehydrogenase [Paratrimastix pyriformis]|uniref:Malate dehydrogenase n=1 Tax=Paratrimastix pyriformis TaxID=342808 RepID=A0ABQ8UWY7_9EUKA|nr:putative Malate dehydrogenase [Paratrimastix pyriformis]
MSSLTSLPLEILWYLIHGSPSPIRTYAVLIAQGRQLRRSLRGTALELDFEDVEEHPPAPFVRDKRPMILSQTPPSRVPCAQALAALVGPCSRLQKLRLSSFTECGREAGVYSGWVDEAFSHHCDLHTLVVGSPKGLSEEALCAILVRLGASLQDLTIQQFHNPPSRLLEVLAGSCPNLLSLTLESDTPWNCCHYRILSACVHLRRLAIGAVPWENEDLFRLPLQLPDLETLISLSVSSDFTLALSPENVVRLREVEITSGEHFLRSLCGSGCSHLTSLTMMFPSPRDLGPDVAAFFAANAATLQRVEFVGPPMEVVSILARQAPALHSVVIQQAWWTCQPVGLVPLIERLCRFVLSGCTTKPLCSNLVLQTSRLEELLLRCDLQGQCTLDCPNLHTLSLGELGTSVVHLRCPGLTNLSLPRSVGIDTLVPLGRLASLDYIGDLALAVLRTSFARQFASIRTLDGLSVKDPATLGEICGGTWLPHLSELTAVLANASGLNRLIVAPSVTLLHISWAHPDVPGGVPALIIDGPALRTLSLFPIGTPIGTLTLRCPRLAGLTACMVTEEISLSSDAPLRSLALFSAPVVKKASLYSLIHGVAAHLTNLSLISEPRQGGNVPSAPAAQSDLLGELPRLKSLHIADLATSVLHLGAPSIVDLSIGDSPKLVQISMARCSRLENLTIYRCHSLRLVDLPLGGVPFLLSAKVHCVPPKLARMKVHYYNAEDLRQYIVRFFHKLGVPEADAALAADVLISADLRGVDSHGIIRLSTYYGDRIKRGFVDPTTPFRVERETPVSLSVDGGNGLGQVVSHKCMQMCIEKAKQSGMCFCAIHNSNHYGIAGYYAMMALPENMIGFSFTNSQPLVAPTYGRTSMLGTNPIAVAVPCQSHRPFVLDMATSTVPIGRVNVYLKAGKPLPAGWAIDGQGNVTTDPNQVIDGRGSLMPLGGIDLMRGYKGYGLAMMVDILSGVLSAANFGNHVAHPHDDRNQDVGHFIGCMRIDLFRDAAQFKADMDRLVQELIDSPKAEGQQRIYVPGEKEYENEERNRTNGVGLLETVVAGLVKSGHEIGVEFTELHPIRTEERA